MQALCCSVRSAGLRREAGGVGPRWSLSCRGFDFQAAPALALIARQAARLPRSRATECGGRTRHHVADRSPNKKSSDFGEQRHVLAFPVARCQFGPAGPSLVLAQSLSSGGKRKQESTCLKPLSCPRSKVRFDYRDAALVAKVKPRTVTPLHRQQTGKSTRESCASKTVIRRAGLTSEGIPRMRTLLLFFKAASISLS